MALLAEPLFQDGEDLATIQVTLHQDTPNGEVTITAHSVNWRGGRKTKVARIRSDDVAGLENVPEVLRILGQMWLWDDVNLVETAIRLVKKGRRPTAQQ